MLKSFQHPLHEIAVRQFGLVHRSQLSELGLGPAEVYRLATSGEWEWATPLVLRSMMAYASTDQRLKLALLDAGAEAHLSHATAAAIWGTVGFDLEPPQVIVLRYDTPREDHYATVHRTRVLKPSHVTTKFGWPVTTPTRTLFDLAAVIHPKRLERALDSMWAQRLVSHTSLHLMLDDLRGRGRAGIGIMRELIGARGEGYRAPESQLERRFEDLVTSAGLPAPDRQVDLCDEEGFIARVDYLFTRFDLVVFIDSDRYHTAKLDREHDDRQTARLQRLGYRVLRIAEYDLRFESLAVLDAIRRYTRVSPGVLGG